jgi:hypothetical protein
VRGVLERVEQRTALLGRQVQLARAAIGNVDGNDAIDFFPIWLNSYCDV